MGVRTLSNEWGFVIEDDGLGVAMWSALERDGIQASVLDDGKTLEVTWE